jgi:hypothetical protein
MLASHAVPLISAARSNSSTAFSGVAAPPGPLPMFLSRDIRFTPQPSFTACGEIPPAPLSGSPATMMNVYGSSEEHQPVTYLRGYPIYAAHFVVLVFVASMLLTTILMAIEAVSVLNWLTFSSGNVLKGQIWRIATYGLVNPPSLLFAVDMVMIVWFGRELEKHFGRRVFAQLYTSLYFLTPLLFTVIGLWRPMSLGGETGAFALFVAFATVYPNVPLLFNLLAKWVALILVGIYSLMALAARDMVSLLSLWATVGFAFAFVRYQQGHFTLPKLRFGRRETKLRVLPDLPEKKSSPPSHRVENSMAEVDALLDKIARSGIASLTAKERAKLDAARDDLKKKTSSRH